MICMIPSAWWLIYGKVNVLLVLSRNYEYLISYKYFHEHFSYTPYYVFQVQYMYYNPWKEDRFGGREEENNLITQGYVRTEESATCMVRMQMLI